MHDSWSPLVLFHQEHFLSKSCDQLLLFASLNFSCQCENRHVDLLCCCLGSFTSCSAASSESRTSDSENSDLIAASHCHVSCFACHYYDKVWVLFPWTSVSWDDVWLMFDLSWAPRRDFCQHTQSNGHQRGSDVPLCTTRRLGGTSVPESGHVHF